jgi:hypothetical protein
MQSAYGKTFTASKSEAILCSPVIPTKHGHLFNKKANKNLQFRKITIVDFNSKSESVLLSRKLNEVSKPGNVNSERFKNKQKIHLDDSSVAKLALDNFYAKQQSKKTYASDFDSRFDQSISNRNSPEKNIKPELTLKKKSAKLNTYKYEQNLAQKTTSNKHSQIKSRLKNGSIYDENYEKLKTKSQLAMVENEYNNAYCNKLSYASSKKSSHCINTDNLKVKKNMNIIGLANKNSRPATTSSNRQDKNLEQLKHVANGLSDNSINKTGYITNNDEIRYTSATMSKKSTSDDEEKSESLIYTEMEFSDESIIKTDLKARKMTNEKVQSNENQVRSVAVETKTFDRDSQLMQGFIPKSLEDVLENIQKRMTKLEERIKIEEGKKLAKSGKDTSNQSSDIIALKKTKPNNYAKIDQTNRQQSGSQAGMVEIPACEDKPITAKKDASTSPVFVFGTILKSTNYYYNNRKSKVLRQVISPIPPPIIDENIYSIKKNTPNKIITIEDRLYASCYSPRLPRQPRIRIFDFKKKKSNGREQKVFTIFFHIYQIYFIVCDHFIFKYIATPRRSSSNETLLI